MLALTCAAAYLPAIATSLLQQHGSENLADLAGGIQAWVGVEHAARVNPEEPHQARI